MSQGLYMSPTRQQSLQVPNLSPHHLLMRPMIGMQYGMPQFGSYFPTNYPIFPPSLSGLIPPQVPPMDAGTGSLPWGQPRPLIQPQQLRFPSQASQSVYTTTPSPDNYSNKWIHGPWSTFISCTSDKSCKHSLLSSSLFLKGSLPLESVLFELYYLQKNNTFETLVWGSTIF